MATAYYEDGDQVGFEEAMLWLPFVLDEACDTKAQIMMQHNNRKQLPQQRKKQQYRPKSAAEPPSLQHSKSSSRPYHRPKLAKNWAGHGMQAVFLESGHRSEGTGVFLPQTAGTNFQPSKKPAFAPVLLPARVVQALNLNVHALGLQISQRQDHNKANPKCGDFDNSTKKNNDNDMSKQCCVISQNFDCSPELFLPKEWTY
ncbi:G patch domain-containing 3 [Quillaja saponaria]|uniref:G patch domain-containing 3 n=1 Tax=Quillaja saponaria TaxID=32244 RepID=A0AAD7Q108_QUISA|nr:G patch domain-containing 3 [Quillaja saponaria]